MKITTRLITLLAGAALAVAFTGTFTSTAAAQETKKGAQLLMEFKHIQTVGELEALEPGDAIAMSCPKCKSVTVTYVEKTIKATDAKEKTMLKHLCPGCETTFKVEGIGKGKKDVLVHKCAQCGSKDVFCCVMKKGAKGMEEKK